MSDLNSDGLTALLALCRNDRITEVAQAIRDSEWLKDHDASARRDAQAEVLAWIESEYSGGTATKLAMDHARSHFSRSVPATEAGDGRGLV